MKSRAERKALVKEMAERAKTYPVHLVPVPEGEWSPRRAGRSEYPIALWRSRSYLVAVYQAPRFTEALARRLSVNRVTVGADGHWEQNIPWEDLQRCKRETGHGDWYGLEVYPRDRDLVNVANMRHLWLFEEPLAIGWFEETATPEQV